MSAAMAGSEVAMTVESMFSMNRAVATISGMMRSLFIKYQGGGATAGTTRCNTLPSDELLRNWMADLNLRDGKSPEAEPRCSKACAWRFDSAQAHAIDPRQPHRWAPIRRRRAELRRRRRLSQDIAAVGRRK